MPGQYLEILPPQDGWLARAYSIGNAPRDDGSVELQIRHVTGGRLTEWLFENLREGEVVKARGPQGHFTLRSAPGTPLIFVAGGTGFAPIKAIMEQQIAHGLTADMRLLWGVGAREDLYELDILAEWGKLAVNVHCSVAVQNGPLPEGLPANVLAVSGSVAQAISISGANLAGYDGYVAGPPVMMSSVVEALMLAGVNRERIRIDPFGL
jgi:CDP-4-dehydro-6-deoxyglucose reductase